MIFYTGSRTASTRCIAFVFRNLTEKQSKQTNKKVNRGKAKKTNNNNKINQNKAPNIQIGKVSKSRKYQN